MTDQHTDLFKNLNIQLPDSLPAECLSKSFFTIILSNCYFENLETPELLRQSFTAGYLLRVLLESQRDIFYNMTYHASSNFSQVEGLLVGEGRPKAAEILKDSCKSAINDYFSLTHHFERWQDESVDEIIRFVVFFFNLGYEVCHGKVYHSVPVPQK